MHNYECWKVFQHKGPKSWRIFSNPDKREGGRIWPSPLDLIVLTIPSLNNGSYNQILITVFNNWWNVKKTHKRKIKSIPCNNLIENNAFLITLKKIITSSPTIIPAVSAGPSGKTQITLAHGLFWLTPTTRKPNLGSFWWTI